MQLLLARQSKQSQGVLPYGLLLQDPGGEMFKDGGDDEPPTEPGMAFGAGVNRLSGEHRRTN